MRPLSEAWTAEDRLRVVAAILPGIQADIYAGRYSQPGRPNIMSLSHVIYDAPAELEPLRAEFERIVAEAEQGLE